MSELIKTRTTLTEPEVRFYMLQLIDAVKYLHRIAVIHRDLKLANLLLDERLAIKVGDFGLAAKLLHENDKKQTMCGTPNYIAPEILQGNHCHSFEVDSVVSTLCQTDE
jgi:serine/threonine protein kinase